MKTVLLLPFIFFMLAECNYDLEQCRASCLENHPSVATVVRGKQGPRGLPGPEGPPGKDCGVSSFEGRVDGLESKLVVMETKVNEQQVEIEMLKRFKEEKNRPGRCNGIFFSLLLLIEVYGALKKV